MLKLSLSDSEAFAVLLACETLLIDCDTATADALQRPLNALYSHGTAAPFLTALEAHRRRS